MNMVPKLEKCLNSVKNLLFPIKCDLCGTLVETNGFCHQCWKKISWISDQKCRICGTPFEVNIHSLCAECVKEKPFFDKAISVFKYDDFSKELLIKFKHFDTIHMFNRLSALMFKSAEFDIKNSDIIVPIPIHFIKRLKRKYNQSELLAKNISRISNIKYEPRILQKIKITHPQEGLSGRKRRKNIIGSFGVNEKHIKDIENKNIILVDDVFTTGSTVNECSRILKKYRAKSVVVVTIARVVLNSL